MQNARSFFPGYVGLTWLEWLQNEYGTISNETKTNQTEFSNNLFEINYGFALSLWRTKETHKKPF